MFTFLKIDRVKRRGSFPFYRQHDTVDCGPTCLMMVAKHYGKRYALQHLRELSCIDRQGVSILGISEAAERIGFRTLGTKVTYEQLVQHAPMPCIAHWQQQHFVVVYAVTETHVQVADPASGLIRYTKEDFLKGWLSSTQGGEDFGVLLLLEPTPAFFEQEGDEEHRKTGFRLLVPYLRTYKRYVLQLLIGIVAISILQLVFPFLTQAIVDVGITNQDLDFIHLVLIAQLMLIASRTAVTFIQSWIVLHVGTRIDISMISDFLIKLMRLPVAFFDAKMTGDLLQRIDDHTRVKEFLTNTLLSILSAGLGLVVFGFVLAFYSLKIFLVFVVGSALYLGYISFFLKRRRELDYKRFAQMADNQNLLIETITGMQEIKLFNAEQQKRWNWERLQARLFRISIKGLALDQYQQGGGVCINEVKNILITIMAAQLVIAGQITLGALLAIQYILGQLNGPINQLILFFQVSQDAKISLERLDEIHSGTNEEEEEQALRFLPERPSLRLQGASFRYGGPHNDPVLKDLDLVIPEGQVTAIVGSSGSGKTTLMKLLLKIYEPQQGQIYIGDTNLRHLSHRFWRNQCGVVMQDGHIFSDTIANNIALGEEIIDKERLLQAVKVACIQDVIERLPLAYNTKVGREGIGLSMGQQQRLLIARAVYKNPRYLFFDEATSALDAETERRIVENLQTFFQGRTVVVIAHRLSTVKNADQIVVLEHGQIIEQGVHGALVQQEGRYYELIKNQLELGR